MRKKHKLIWLIFAISLLLAGCNRGQSLPSPVLQEQDSQKQGDVVKPSGVEVLQKNEEHNSDVISPESVQIDTEKSVWIDTKKVNQMLEELNTKEKYLDVMQVGEETVLLHCLDRETGEYNFYVLYMKEGEESIRSIELGLTGMVECYTYEDCMVLYDTWNCVIVMDYQFEILDEIMISNKIHLDWYYGDRRNYCVLPRDQKILYYKTVLENNENYVGLFETDYSCEEERLLYRLEGPETNLNYFNGFSKISPGYSEKGIFFDGYYFEAIGVQSKECVGYLDLDSKEPVVCKTTMERMELTSNGVIFYDGYRETDREYSGKLLAIDESGNVSWITTATYFKESERVSCDRQGGMLTCYKKENGESVLNLYKENVWEMQIVVPEGLADFILLNRGQCILCSYRSSGELQIVLQEI